MTSSDQSDERQALMFFNRVTEVMGCMERIKMKLVIGLFA